MSSRAVTSGTAALEWDVAAAAAPGETAPGDRAVVAFAGEHILAAAVDGLGHGPEAAAAAEAAAAVLERSAGEDPVATVQACHRALRDTRGAALSLASIDLATQTMTWLGAGNVEGRLLRGAGPVVATQSLLVHGGIVGHDLPRVSPQVTTIGRGDVLIFATDGVRREFADALTAFGACRDIAAAVLDRYALGSDDALVLVARFLGRP